MRHAVKKCVNPLDTLLDPGHQRNDAVSNNFLSDLPDLGDVEPWISSPDDDLDAADSSPETPQTAKQADVWTLEFQVPPTDLSHFSFVSESRDLIGSTAPMSCANGKGYDAGAGPDHRRLGLAQSLGCVHDKRENRAHMIQTFVHSSARPFLSDLPSSLLPPTRVEPLEITWNTSSSPSRMSVSPLQCSMCNKTFQRPCQLT